MHDLQKKGERMKDRINDIIKRIENYLSSTNARNLSSLAKNSGVNQSVISRWISKETKNPSLKNILAVEKYLNKIENQKYDITLTENWTKAVSDKDNQVVLEKYLENIICHSSITIHVYMYLMVSEPSYLTTEDIALEYGKKGLSALNYLIENNIVIEESSGRFIPKIENFCTFDYESMLQILVADLENFDLRMEGKGSALARYSKKCSKLGLAEIRSKIYQTLLDIKEIARKNPGEVEFYSGLYLNIYSKNNFDRN